MKIIKIQRRIHLLSRRILVSDLKMMGSTPHLRKNLRAQKSQLCLQKKIMSTKIAILPSEKNSRHNNRSSTLRNNQRVVLRRTRVFDESRLSPSEAETSQKTSRSNTRTQFLHQVQEDLAPWIVLSSFFFSLFFKVPLFNRLNSHSINIFILHNHDL